METSQSETDVKYTKSVNEFAVFIIRHHHQTSTITNGVRPNSRPVTHSGATQKHHIAKKHQMNKFVM